MFDVTRRQALALGGAGISFAASVQRRGCRRDRRQADDRFQRQPSLVRSDGRALGGQSDDPGDLPRDLRSALSGRSPTFLRARPSDHLGLERRQDRRPGWMCARASSGTTGRPSRRKTSSGRSSAQATRRPAIRSSSSGARSAISRSTAIASPPTSSSSTRRCSNGWRSSPAISCRRRYYTKVGAEGFEKKPIGAGPYMVDEYQGNAFLRLKRNDKYWGAEAGVRDRHLQVRARRHEPRRRDRERFGRRDARNPVRGIRPAEGETGPRRRVRTRSPTSA